MGVMLKLRNTFQVKIKSRALPGSSLVETSDRLASADFSQEPCERSEGGGMCLDSQKLVDNACCFKLLILGVSCYAAIDN